MIENSPKLMEDDTFAPCKIDWTYFFFAETEYRILLLNMLSEVDSFQEVRDDYMCLHIPVKSYEWNYLYQSVVVVVSGDEIVVEWQ